MSSATLDRNANGEKVWVEIENEGKKYTLCSLQKDKVEHVPLDLYFKTSDNVTFSVAGKNTVHLTGYWEPNTDLNNDDLGLGMMPNFEEEEEESEDEEGDETSEKLKVAQ